MLDTCSKPCRTISKTREKRICDFWRCSKAVSIRIFHCQNGYHIRRQNWSGPISTSTKQPWTEYREMKSSSSVLNCRVRPDQTWPTKLRSSAAGDLPARENAFRRCEPTNETRLDLLSST